MKNRALVIFACAVTVFVAFFITQEVQAEDEMRALRVQILTKEFLEKEEEKTEEKGSLVSGSVEVIGSKDTGVWVYAERKVARDWGFFINAVKYQKGFQEVTFGPTYYITKELQVGVSLGAARNTSSDDSRLFISAFGYLETNNLKAEIILERFARDSQDISYYRFYFQTPTPISDKLAFGVYGEKSVGWGPRISWSFNKNVNLWLSPLIERQGGNVVVGGIQFTF